LSPARDRGDEDLLSAAHPSRHCMDRRHGGSARPDGRGSRGRRGPPPQENAPRAARGSDLAGFRRVGAATSASALQQASFRSSTSPSRSARWCSSRGPETSGFSSSSSSSTSSSRRRPDRCWLAGRGAPDRHGESNIRPARAPGGAARRGRSGSATCGDRSPGMPPIMRHGPSSDRGVRSGVEQGRGAPTSQFGKARPSGGEELEHTGRSSGRVHGRWVEARFRLGYAEGHLYGSGSQRGEPVADQLRHGPPR
jgi:hypothetical protein